MSTKNTVKTVQTREAPDEEEDIMTRMRRRAMLLKSPEIDEERNPQRVLSELETAPRKELERLVVHFRHVYHGIQKCMMEHQRDYQVEVLSKISVIEQLQKEKRDVFNQTKEKARKEMEGQIQEEKNTNHLLRGLLEREKEKVKHLQNQLTASQGPLKGQRDEARPAQTKKQTGQVKALTEQLQSEQKEKEQLREQIRELESALSDAQDKLQKEKERDEQHKEKKRLQKDRDLPNSEVNKLKYILNQKQTQARVTQDKLQTVQKERDELQKEKDHLQKERDSLYNELKKVKSSLSQQKLINTEAQKKILLLQKDNSSLKDVSRAFNVLKQKFTDMVRQCYAAVSTARKEKDEMQKSKQQLSEEMEALKVLHKEQVMQVQSSEEEKRTIQKQMEELSAALKASEEKNFALFKQNNEFKKQAEYIQDHFLQKEKRVKKKRFGVW